MMASGSVDSELEPVPPELSAAVENALAVVVAAAGALLRVFVVPVLVLVDVRSGGGWPWCPCACLPESWLCGSLQIRRDLPGYLLIFRRIGLLKLVQYGHNLDEWGKL